MQTSGTPGQEWLQGATPDACFYGAGNGGCLDSLVVGFIQTNDLFGTSLCQPGVPQATTHRKLTNLANLEH